MLGSCAHPDDCRIYDIYTKCYPICFVCYIIISYIWSADKPAILLLQAIERTGSINSAAQSLGIQYKSAWHKLEQINNLLPYPLMKKRTGGSGGGGSVLTEEGKKLLRQVDALQKEFSQFMQFFTDDPNGALQTLKTLRRIEMKLSARNVWLG